MIETSSPGTGSIRVSPVLVAMLVATLAVPFATTACKSQEGKTGTKTTERTIAGGDLTTNHERDSGSLPPPSPLVLPPVRPLPPPPLGLPVPPSPPYNPTTAEKVALGALLFADSKLSASGAMACISCHDAGHGYSNTAAINSTDEGSKNLRHTPGLTNLAYHSEFYWDGRSTPLEAAILGHWAGQLGLGPQAFVDKVADNHLYLAHFQRAFKSAPDPDRAAEALAAYVRSLLGGNSAWDRYEAGDLSAVSGDAIAGAKIFRERAGCATCHAPPLYTDLGYHNLALPARPKSPDLGRETVTKSALDRGAFKTPGLRDVSKRSPYFHNGSAATLMQVLEHKESQGSPRLTSAERAQLIAFLRSLNSLDATALDATALDATALDATALDATALDATALDATAQGAKK